MRGGRHERGGGEGREVRLLRDVRHALLAGGVDDHQNQKRGENNRQRPEGLELTAEHGGNSPTRAYSYS
mgnify:CR=1 FL=1